MSLNNQNPYSVLQDICDIGDAWNPLASFPDWEDDEVPIDPSELLEIGEESVEVARKYGFTGYALHPFTRVEGEEVGDDRIDMCGNPLQLATGLVCQERVCGMKTSEEDTFISTWLWNFCEVSSQVPGSPEESFDAARKSGKFQNLGFTDVPPLRIILDVMKGDRSHSSTAVGKMTMLANRGRTPRSEFLRDFHLASFLQDGFLRTCRASDPKYLPAIMGGAGVRPLYSNALNLYLYIRAYRGGRYHRIYGSATRELRQSLDSLEKGERVIMPILCRRLRDRQEYLHATYDAKILIPGLDMKSRFKGELPEPLIMSSGGANLFASFENRLTRTKHLLTRTSAELEWENSLRIRERLLSRGIPTTVAEEHRNLSRKRGRSEFDMALNANAAFANLLNRRASIQDVIQLIQDKFQVVNCGAVEFTKWDAQWLFFGGKSEHFSIEDLTSSEDLFLRKEVSEEESMKVGSLLLRPIVGLTERQVTTTTHVGLYEIGSGMFEWAADLAARLEARRDMLGRALLPEDALSEYEQNPEWVNDDSLIIERCRRDTKGRAQRSTYVCLVSADKRLGHQLAETCNVIVFAIHPLSYILWAKRRNVSPIVETKEIQSLLQILPKIAEGKPLSHCYVDTGSVNAFLSRLGTNETGVLIERRHISQAGGFSNERPRQTTYQLHPVPDKYFGRCMQYYPVTKPKRYRLHGPISVEGESRFSVLSAHSMATISSWRSGI